ncbi:hypothetical protein O181_018551 [Austropuccinia psidii MF-1]|uniref:Uncharacterized protein n=1 Tax=Austropuccinia psidii MF-1 TaxID=1389203 RepID=A0A9Q3C9U5_9BASI|nr:hypothetical protein [Austropuccinia psidii MF-1]
MSVPVQSTHWNSIIDLNLILSHLSPPFRVVSLLKFCFSSLFSTIFLSSSSFDPYLTFLYSSSVCLSSSIPLQLKGKPLIPATKPTRFPEGTERMLAFLVCATSTTHGVSIHPCTPSSCTAPQFKTCYMLKNVAGRRVPDFQRPAKYFTVRSFNVTNDPKYVFGYPRALPAISWSEKELPWVCANENTKPHCKLCN